jgi:hypothetical protein
MSLSPAKSNRLGNNLSPELKIWTIVGRRESIIKLFEK